ncbi:alkaline phytoceramidase [Auriculariales sp. MPI-PUGE-AT-0066]|nr:alkaline phytoceramidase [Auriculariales sp. MPI-PUGE-AT-0066]
MVNIHFRGKTYPGGFWGPRTATLDWCEPNYKHSPYIAEMANSVSNLIMLLFAVIGFALVQKERLPTRYLLAQLVPFSLAFAAVAVGSFAFHGTLLYEMQLLDELPMIISSSTSIYCLFDTGKGFALNKLFTTALVVANIFFAGTYSTIWRHPLYHQGVFAIAMISIPSRTTYLLNSSKGKGLSARQRHQIITLNVTGAILFIAGFAIWNVDNIWCEVWDGIKYKINWPAAFLLEGHSWWHLFIGAGTYYLLVGISYLTLAVKDIPSRYTLKYFLGLPYSARASSTLDKKK